MSGVKWGEPILVNGVKPSWLRKEEGLFENSPGDWIRGEGESLESWSWHDGHDPCPINIRLPATHPFYTVQYHNAKHGTNFTYWPGGDCAPCGVDEGDDVLLRGGAIGGGYNWTHSGGPRDIIGYTRRPTATHEAFIPLDPNHKIELGHVSVKRMTEAEAANWWDEIDGKWDGSEYAIVFALRHLGLIREPTQAERIAAKVGLSAEQVEAVLREAVQ